ncbi:MAG: GAF domain-containing protein [Chloroflexota bacterium]|nr:MAG: GAF domain-containing protein [Chloroflexota bacterium]
MKGELRVLLVEDSENDAFMLLRQLRRGGYEVVCCQVDNPEAMQSALDAREWDIVIADDGVAGFGGFDALHILKERGLDVPFILVAEMVCEDTAENAMEAGVDDYVSKSHLTRLLPAVERQMREMLVCRERNRADKIQSATYRISESASSAENLQDLYQAIHRIVGELMPAPNFYIAQYDPERDLLSFPYFVDEMDSIPEPHKPGKGLSGYVLKTGKPLHADRSTFAELVEAGVIESIGSPSYDWLGVPLRTQERTIGMLGVQSYTENIQYGEEEMLILEFVSTQVAMAISHKEADQALVQSEARYRSLFENSPVSLWEEDFSEVKARIEALRSQGIFNFRAYFDEHPEAAVECMRRLKVIEVNQATLRLYGAASKAELLSNMDRMMGEKTLPIFKEELVAIAEGQTEFEGIGVNEKISGYPFDVILRWSVSPEYVQTLSRVIVTVIDVSDRKVAERRIQSQIQKLDALRTIDMAITASLDLRVTLDVLLDQVITQLHVDAADILLLRPHSQILEYAASRGFLSTAITRSRLHLNEGYAGRAARERQTLAIPDLTNTNDFLKIAAIAGEKFIAYYGVPLIAKGQVKGVLEVFHRSPLQPDVDWLDFLETLAGQAAIAIDNASLFENLQRSNVELALAYDATIEGWSRALDLRDHETEGHTERVTEMTVRLCSVLGINNEELVHIRRGALLHDIGKMGISDSILLKPGPLSEEKWKVMRMHPVYAYELLSPISYLRPALDIPYCHHEKWDGSGYPRGLRQEDIPLSARIFAVVDVWDALRSDRPYRPAWPDEQVLEYIYSQSGKHFDPQITELFLNFLSRGEYNTLWRK